MLKHQVMHDEELIDQLEKFLEQQAGADLNPAAKYEDLKASTLWTKELQTSAGVQALSGMALSWPDPVVRLVLLEALPAYLPRTVVVDAIAKLAEDPDDFVCMAAMRICGDYNVQEIIPYLEKIVGLPSKTANNPGSPVGRGAAVVHTALMKIFSASDDDFRAESFYRENGYRHHSLDHELIIDQSVIHEFRAQKFTGMQLIPQGASVIGLDRFDIPDASFKWTKAVPRRQVWLPDFYIDTHPVTNADYDLFCEEAEGQAEMFVHPFHPDSKTTFVRNTYGDSRFGADHPVTGVDWYDAFAYANWAGKSLPSAYQWEKAARGSEESIWPWGNEWDSEMCHWGEKAFDQKISSITQWRELLAAIDFNQPFTTTRPVHEEHESSYGVRGLVGNAWEFTSTDYDSGYGFSPASEARTQRAPSVVLKGGSWTSLPGLMFPSYWGQDAPFCRHNEIGFRCVVNLSPKALQTDPSFHQNTALHF